MTVWLPYAVIVLLLIVLIVLVVLVLRAGDFTRLRPGAAPAARGPDAPLKPGELAPPARLSTAIAIAGRELRDFVSGGAGPAEVPWTLVIGAGGDDLAALLPPPLDARHAIRWTDEKRLSNVGTLSFRTGGVVVGFEDGLVGGARADRRLADLLRELEVVRPDRPLDSLVIVVPWQTLAAANDDAAREAVALRGRQLYQILLAVQQRTGWRVPVHVLLSGCEAIPGFTAYAAATLLRSDDPAIGWPAPKSLDTMFETGWIDEAFETLRATLSAEQFHLLMGLGDPTAVEDVLLFPARLGAVRAPLTLLLTQMLQSSAYHEGFMLRGVFLTGETGAPAADPAVTDEAAVAALGVAVPTEATVAALEGAPRPAQRLAQTLFLDKIFPESHLAQPAYGERTRRHRMVRRAKYTLAAAIALFAIAILGIRYENAQHMAPVRDLLQNIVDIEGEADRRRTATHDPETGRCLDTVAPPVGESARGADFREKRRLSIVLLDRMSDLDVNHVATVLAPTSFLAPSDARVEEAIRRSFQQVVFHAISESMATRAGITALVSRNASDPQADSYWTATVRNVVDYDTNFRLVGSLERRTGRDPALVGNFAALVAYSLSERLPAGFMRHDELYTSGIANYAVPCMDSTEARDTLKRIIGDRYRAVVDRFYLDSPVLRIATSIDRRFGGAGGGDATDASLVGLIADIEALAGQLAMPGRYDWIFAERAGVLPLPPTDRLLGLDAVDPAFVADLPSDSRDRAFAAATRLRDAHLFDAPLLTHGAASILGTPLAAATPTAPAADPDAPRLTRALIDAHDYLRALFAQPFMVSATPPALGFAGRNWDYARLRSAADLAKTYATFRESASGEMPVALRTIALTSAEDHVTRRLDQIIDAATPAAAGGGGALAEAETGAFIQALPMLAALRTALDDAGATDAAARLDARVDDRAGGLLTAAYRQIGGLYAVDAASLAAWHGSGSLAGAAFGVEGSDDLVPLVAARRAQVIAVAQARATALVGYLRDSAPSAASAAPAAKWQSILDTLRAYQPGSSGTTLGRLEAFITVGIDAHRDDCSAIRAPRNGPDDYFVDQQAAIAAAVRRRCQGATAASAGSLFERLRNAFLAHLAGRFPFGGETAPPADPGEVQRFFATYGDALQPLRARIEAEHPGAAAATAIGELINAQIALAPMLAGPGPLTYKVDVAFLTDPAISEGQGQVAEARLGSGRNDGAHTPHGPDGFTWTNGQPVTLTLRWGLNTPSVPIEAIEPHGRCVPPPGGGVATVREMGDWALLRFLKRYALPNIPASVDEGSPVVVSIPVCANLQRISGGDDQPGAAVIVSRLKLSATIRTPDKPDRQVPVVLPVFPRSLPPLPAAR